MDKRFKATILYATETGKSEKFAHTLNEIFLFGFDSKVMCMEDYEVDLLKEEQCVMVITSTFGNGESPDNGKVSVWRRLLKFVLYYTLLSNSNMKLAKFRT